MPFEPGHIVLLGSGETSPSIRTVYHWLFTTLNEPIHTAILETPAGFEPNSRHVAEQIEQFIAKRLQNFKPQISIIPARKKGTAHSPDDPAIASQLHPANVILTGPGSPSYAARQLRDSLTWHTLQACHRAGASLIFASASTIALSQCALPVYEIYKVGEDLHWKPGLNFFEPFGLSLIFIPHWNNNDGGDGLDTSHCYMGLDRYTQLIAMLPGQPTLVGIDENTAMTINPITEECRMMGAGGAVIIRNGHEKRFPKGSTFQASELGPFKLPQPTDGIPTELWETVVEAKTVLAQAAEDGPKPSATVLALVEQRTAARAAKDWAAADSLRDQIEARGWAVKDSAAGAILDPL